MAMAEDCFLCTPEEDLIYWADQDNLALCGLGPLVRGYSVVATRQHIRSAADAAGGDALNFLSFVSTVRTKLENCFGSCLLAEHGRVPVCVDPSGTSDPHCYHAHFLLFPAAPAIEEKALLYFARVKETRSLERALAIAEGVTEYFLLSPSPDKFLIMTRPGRLIRQFVRFLVSDAIGQPELANWREYSKREEAVLMATELRLLFHEDKQ